MKLFLLSSSLLATNLLSLVSAAASPVVFPVKLTWEKGAPDGFTRDMIFMNGEFPGPALNINEGDDVEVSSKAETEENFILKIVVCCR